MKIDIENISLAKLEKASRYLIPCMVLFTLVCCIYSVDIPLSALLLGLLLIPGLIIFLMAHIRVNREENTYENYENRISSIRLRLLLFGIAIAILWFEMTWLIVGYVLVALLFSCYLLYLFLYRFGVYSDQSMYDKDTLNKERRVLCFRWIWFCIIFVFVTTLKMLKIF